MFILWASSCGLKVWLATGVLPILPISEEQTGQNKEATRRKCTSVEMIGELKHKLKSMLERFCLFVSIDKSVWLCSHWPCLLLLLFLLPCTKQKCVFLGFDSTKSIQHMVCILRKAIYFTPSPSSMFWKHTAMSFYSLSDSLLESSAQDLGKLGVLLLTTSTSRR